MPTAPDFLAIINNLWGTASPFLSPALDFLKSWWWVFLPFILIRPFLFLWLWWKIENWLNTVYKPILLEIKIPKDSLKPIRAMENVLTSINQIINQWPDWWEKWIDGQVQTTAFLEMISTGGEIHFFIRIHSDYRQAVESAIYAQYPEAEITQAQDYTKLIPSDIPNKDWDLFGSHYRLIKEDHYPIRTYPSFETETESEEEKRIDPVAHLLEAMAKLKEGEHLWIQIAIEPFMPENGLAAWVKKGEELRDKLSKRPEKSKSKPMVQEAADLLLFGTVPGAAEEEKEEMFPPEMRLTPGEKTLLEAVELKMAKPLFKTFIRFIYFGERDVWFKPNFRLAFSFFSQYSTTNMNSLQVDGAKRSLTKIKKSWFLPLNFTRKRRMYLRQRRLFRYYTNRLSPLYPRPSKDLSFIMSVEEITSLFHFPSWLVSPVPGVPRVEAKKGAPPNLPTD